MTKFQSSESKLLRFRRGEFKHEGPRFSTPCFMPIVNLITGPPPIFANGGVWRHIKIELFQKARIPAFMTQILHFTDFNIQPKGLNRWFETTIPDRIRKEAGYSPFLFIDSGGYRLLYNTSLDLDRFKISSTVKSIMDLQSRFGGNAVATLDYPIPPGLNDYETGDRIKKTITNCIRSGKLHQRLLGEDTLLYMCVHGRNYAEAKRTVENLLARMKQERLSSLPFGIAIGSLVPLSNSPRQVIDIVKGVTDAIRESNWVQPCMVPVHAFGVSSRMIPILAALGVDSFDGTTYVQQAQTMRYRRTRNFSYVSFFDLAKIECGCPYCKALKQEDLETTKNLLRGRSYGKIHFGGKETTKSYIYALIALHNLQGSFNIIQKVRDSTSSEDALKDLLADSTRDVWVRKNWAYLVRYFPDLSDYLWGLAIDTDFGIPKRTSRLYHKPICESGQIASLVEASEWHPKARREISLLLGPDDFDIDKMDYCPPKRKVLLILPCTQKKPYSESPSHGIVARSLKDASLDERNYCKVSLSGNYGIVPEEFENDPKVQAYDFYLSSGDKHRIDLLIKRTQRFVARFGDSFEMIIAYCTAKSYREVLEKSLIGVPNAVILPSPLRVRKSSEFRKPENLRQLVQTIVAIVKSDGREA